MKKLYDAIHGFIHFSEIETALVRTAPFQRLQSIHQLGIAFYIYPGGTHKRYEHSMGVMQLATHVYEQVINAFDQRDEVAYIPKIDSFEYSYWLQVLRFAALCHDLGHLPFSHVAERALLDKGGHEMLSVKIIQSKELRHVWEDFCSECEGKKSIDEVISDIVKISVGEEKIHTLPNFPNKQFSPWEKIITEIITGDFFGADRMDYLLRDAQCTGLAYGSFDYHQLIEMLRIFPDPDIEGHCVIGIEENGIESCESLLMARHFMQRRMYQYPSARSYSFHMSRFMANTYKDPEIIRDTKKYLEFTDHQVFVDLGKAFADPTHPGHMDAKAIRDHNERFKAIAIGHPADELFLRELRKELDIPKPLFQWILSSAPSKQIGLTFPVLCRDGQILRGDQLSQIVVPFPTKNWVFVHPLHEDRVRKSLGSRTFTP